MFKKVSLLFWFTLCLNLEANEPARVKLVKVMPIVVSSSERASGAITFEVVKDHHVQANPSGEGLIPTDLNFQASKTLEVGQIIYPEGIKHKVKSLNKVVPTYEGQFTIRYQVKAKQGLKAGEEVLLGELRYQACNAQTCFFPKTLEIKVPVQVISPAK